MSNEVVRTQLTKTIRNKTATIRRLSREEEGHRRDAAALARRRDAVQAEVDELTAHLEKLGGPIKKEAAK